jgi:hypothetical protein
MNDEAPYFHFFRDYEANIYIKYIGQQIKNENEVSLIITFVMFFDNKYYTFIGHSSILENIPISKINIIRSILLKKDRQVTCKEIHNNSIQLDLKFTTDELYKINNS